MRIAICDDMETERSDVIQKLKILLDDFFVDEFEDGNELLLCHGGNPYDIIILDILMPKISGIDVATILRKTDEKTPVIFLSSSEEFAVQSYRVLAFDYLLKPVEQEQLKSCLDRYFSQYKERHYVHVTYSGVDTKIVLSNIQCLESNLRKVIFTLNENREIEVIAKLTDFEEMLLKHGFVRCHKSYLVNMEYIDYMKDNVFHLTGGKDIKISRSYLQSSKKAYFDYVFSAEK